MRAVISKKSFSLDLKLASPSDILSLLKLENSVSHFKTYSPILEESEWKEEMQNGKVFFIESGTTIVGYISYEVKASDHFYIGGLVIHPHFRGKGFGRQAMNLLLERMRHAKRIDLVTHPDNQFAIRLYESLGFKVESRLENYFGDGEPRLLLALERN